MEDFENLQDKAFNSIVKSVTDQQDRVFKEGLRLKGFTFNNDEELKEFAAKRCRAEDYEHEKCKIYFVDDVAFLKHYYEPKINMDYDNNTTNICADFVFFAFI